ncbi:type II secretion system GspH family protein [Candidatus Gracilibacteria bacterium]|nr:type II secretion system GspH family protein [Candidatus Gracilibacteria bacterium]
MYKNKNGFTLIELIVVVTILSILATIGSIYIFNYFKDTRDATRINSVQLISNNLELYYIDNSEYPLPDSPQDITYSGSTVWTQGVFGDGVGRKLGTFGLDTPRDQSYDVFFSYAITNQSQEYQIATILEGGKEEQGLAELTFVPQAHASIPRAYVLGNYNRFMTMIREGSEYTFIATPSIIASNLQSTDVVDIISEQHLVYNDFYNLPESYNGKFFTNGGFDFNVLDPIIFSGNLDVLHTQEGLRDFAQKLRFIYARTPTEFFSLHSSMLQDEGLARFRTYLQRIFSLQIGGAFNCQDLYDIGEIISDGSYTIRGTHNESTAVYCSIDENNIAWTQVTGNFLGSQGGSFAGGNHISTHSFSLYATPSANQIVALASPVLSGYAMRQQGGSISNYEVKIQDFSNILSGDEIRLSLWARGDYVGTWSNNLGFNPEAGYLFHNRVYYTDGTFSTNGELNIVETQDISGSTWNRYEVRHRVRKNPQDFSWYIGLDAADSVDFYFTGVEIEIFRR